MPTKLCNGTPQHRRCSNPATYRGRCQACNQANEQATHNRKGLYSSKRWRLLRRRVLFNQPLCAVDGCDEIAVDCDHILAIEDGGQEWAIKNLQGLCKAHHSVKTSRELRAR